MTYNSTWDFYIVTKTDVKQNDLLCVIENILKKDKSLECPFRIWITY